MATGYSKTKSMAGATLAAAVLLSSCAHKTPQLTNLSPNGSGMGSTGQTAQSNSSVRVEPQNTNKYSGVATSSVQYPDYVDKPTRMRSDGVDYIVTRVRVPVTKNGQTYLDWKNVYTPVGTNAPADQSVPATNSVSIAAPAANKTIPIVALTLSLSTPNFDDIKATFGSVATNLQEFLSLACQINAAKTNADAISAALRQRISDSDALALKEEALIGLQDKEISELKAVIAQKQLIRGERGTTNLDAANPTNTPTVNTDKQ